MAQQQGARLRLHLTAFRLGLLVTAVFLLVKYHFDGFQASDSGNPVVHLENSWLDGKFILRGGRDPARFQEDAHVVIVAVDERSVRKLGMWPWPRAQLAVLVRQLKHCGARVIGFDMIFAEPDASRIEPVVAGLLEQYRRLPGADQSYLALLEQTRQRVQGDRRFAKAVEEAGNVVLGYFFFLEKSELHGLDIKEVTSSELEDIAYSAIGYLVPARQLNPEQACGRFLRPVGVRANIKELGESTDYFGYFNQVPDRDRIYRRVPLVMCFPHSRTGPDGKKKTAYEYLPALSLKVLSLWYGQPIELLVDTLDGQTYYPGHLGLYLGPLGMPGPGHRQIPVESAVRFRLNYYGGSKTFRHLSAADLIGLEGRDPAALPAGDSGRQACRAVRDKVVLVGATTMGIYDLRPTPFETSFPGVEIHATTIENVIRGEYMLRPQLFWLYEAAFMLLAGVLLSWLLGKLRLTVGLLVVLAMMVATVAGDYCLFLADIQSHAVLPEIFMVVQFIALAVWRYATEEREKTRIRHAFQFYLSREVIDEVLRDTSKLKLGGERRELTVLFSDIRGFTTISEKLDPGALTELLNQYLTPMTEIVFANQGTLDKYIGDALMAFFGAPVPFADHAHSACRAALEMMEQLRRLDEQWEARGLPTLEIGIGINTGEVSVGNMGSASRFDYTVIGDNVNLASRLEGLNKAYGTHILISQSTRQAVGGHFTCRLVDSVRVKGKQLPVDIYELIHKGPPQPGPDDWISTFEQALQEYRRRHFQEALRLLLELPEDPVARLFAERCRHMQQHPPPEEWDGVFVATSK